MQINREHILSKIAELESPLVAIEALWDGDTTGWCVCLSAITSDQQFHLLTVFQDGSDLRLFNGQVPPWPEAKAAQTLGNELAQQFGVAFYFPSPEHPEDDCPSWWDRDQGYPCRRCQILLLQSDDCPWRGICNHCDMVEKREQREASWTPEQRAGPRCFLCGNPATHELDQDPVCTTCLERYDVYNCEKCQCRVMTLKSTRHTGICSSCEALLLIESLPDTQRATLQTAKTQGLVQGIQTVRSVLNCSIPEAQDILGVLKSNSI